MIEMHFTINEREYLEAQKIFMQVQNRKARWWRWSLAGILLIGCLVMAFSGALPNGASKLPIALGLAVGASVLVFQPALQRTALRKRFRKEKTHMTNTHLVIDDAGYHAQVPGHGSGTAEWGGMDSWQEGKDVIVLRSGFLLRIVPKQHLTDSALQGLRDLLAMKIGPVGVMRSA